MPPFFKTKLQIMSLELKNVEKKVGIETHIYPTNIKLEKNTINVLLGSTLAGKTTLMQIMAGLDKPTSGEIWFNGENVTGKQVQKRNVSMVYQQFINYPRFTVFENIASTLKNTGVNSDEIKERVGKVAELLKLSAMLDKKPDELSGGQQQRTALARALVKDSDLILLDEPLANLDFNKANLELKKLDKRFENLKKIQNVFISCYFNSPNTKNLFDQLTSDKKTDFSRYNYFYASYLSSRDKNIEAKNIVNLSLKTYPRNLLLSQYKLDLNENKNQIIFDCKKEEHIIAEILYITANALSSQSIYPLSNLYLNLAKYLNEDFNSFDTLYAENFFKIQKNLK